MFDQLAKLRGTVKYQFWAGLGHEGQTLDDLIGAVTKVGNTVMEIDETNQRILVAVWDETHDVHGCLLCLGKGVVTIVDSEAQLLAHCDIEHPDWRERA